MAPHEFWLKRQFGDELPDIDDLPLPDLSNFPVLPRPTRSTDTSSDTASSTRNAASTSAEASSLISSVAPTLSTTSSNSLSTASTSGSESASESVAASSVTSSVTSDVILIETSSPAVDPSTSVLIQSQTVVVNAPVSSSIPSSVSGASKNGFLENKVLSGVVFALCGLFGLILIGALIFLVTRKTRRNRKLEEEIISWDPDHVRGLGAPNHRQDADTRSIEELEEKARGPSSLDGHYNTYTPPSNTFKTNPNPPPFSDYYGPQRTVQVSLPTGQQQPYHNW